MPKAFKPTPAHPAVAALIRLHADVGGKIAENRKQAKRLAADMIHVEAVIRMFSPGYDVTGIAAKRRNKSNPWFKRGTLFRSAVDTLRRAQGTPMTARQITEALIASKGATATPKQVRDLQAGIQTSLRNHKGGSVVPTGEGMPTRWVLAAASGMW